MRTYYKVLKLLKKEMPPKLPVVVRRTKIKEEGYCTKRGDKFHIRINVELSESKVIDVLLHEWAHTLAWTDEYDNWSIEKFREEVHGPAWGLAYSNVYRLFEKHFIRG